LTVEEEQVCTTAPVQSTSWESILADPPWTAKSFLAVGAATVGGLASWIGNITSPAMAEIGGSYLGGFLIGWAFRRFLKMAAMIVAVLLACLGALKATDLLNLDWTSIETQISHALQWLHGEAEGLKNLLTGLLPSAGAAGAGSFFGFRKK
jgi:uncharacterized membrane protein (Fun14 family)